MMTNNEMVLAAIEFGEESFAYDLFYLIQTGVLNGEDEYKDLGETWNKVDASVTKVWLSQNLLGFDVKHLYAVRLNVTDWHLYFARNDSEARGYALNKLGTTRFIKMPSEKQLQSFWIPNANEYKSLLDIKNESNVFPRMALII